MPSGSRNPVSPQDPINLPWGALGSLLIFPGWERGRAQCFDLPPVYQDLSLRNGTSAITHAAALLRSQTSGSPVTQATLPPRTPLTLTLP